jgi:hypothetical protein
VEARTTPRGVDLLFVPLVLLFRFFLNVLHPLVVKIIIYSMVNCTAILLNEGMWKSKLELFFKKVSKNHYYYFIITIKGIVNEIDSCRGMASTRR